MALTGSREISTKPVMTVPAMAPTVPTPESLPTTVPVSARSDNRILVTIGVTADSSAPGTRMAADAARISSGGAHSAAIRTTAGLSATTTPETPIAGAMRRRGSTRSAARPPAHEPRAIAASAMPITSVLVSSVSPR